MAILAVLGAALGVTVLVLVLNGRHAEDQGPGSLTEDENQQVESLISSLSADAPDARAAAAEQLGKRGDKARHAAGRLEEILLQDDSPRVRQSAAVALGQLGVVMARYPPAGLAALGMPVDPQLEKLIAALLKAAEEGNEAVRQGAAEALARIGHEAIWLLSLAIKDGRDARAAEDRAVATLGAAAAPILLQLLRGKEGTDWAAVRRLLVAGPCA